MRNKIFGGLLVLCVGALLAGGCAKKEVVKSEEPVAPVQVAPPTAPQPVQPVQPRPTEPAPVQQGQQPITESPTKEAVVAPESGREAVTQQPAATTGDLQSELQKIYFNFDSAALSDEARSALTKNAEMIKNDNSVKIRIEGNCDERGSDEYNMALGERRAKAAKDYLVNLGVQPNRLTTISYGEEKPADPGHDEAAWAKNRRDEFVIVK